MVSNRRKSSSVINTPLLASHLGEKLEECDSSKVVPFGKSLKVDKKEIKNKFKGNLKKSQRKRMTKMHDKVFTFGFPWLIQERGILGVLTSPLNKNKLYCSLETIKLMLWLFYKRRSK